MQVAGSDKDGRVARATVRLTVDSVTVPVSSSGRVPVILLNGWQFDCSDTASTLVASQDTFGSLWTQLQAQGVPVLYFNNCAYSDVPIESLGTALANFISGLTYNGGSAVPQVDLVTHSMGGLIARAYLAGLQQGGSFSPPPNPQVRKLVEIATPNFGSFIAGDFSLVTANGTQSSEMLPGSSFLWSLARWNQGSDDLRGVDALAIIGNQGSCCSVLFPPWSSASDGVVSVTSASIGFAPLVSARDPSRTRIVPYCHTDAIVLPNCSGPAIAKVDQAPETDAIVLSFLANTSDWESIGSPNQTEYGGIYFALENAAGTQYTDLSAVSLETQPLQELLTGATDQVFYDEFADGTGTLEATSTANQGTNCGSFSVPGGYYTAARCKYNPRISGVQSTLSTGLPGVTVASASSIIISGAGFSSSTGTAVLANGTPLSGQIVSDQEITAFLPSNYSGLVTLAVDNSTGQDAINIVVAPPALPPTISLSPTQLQFLYTVGGTGPAPKNVVVSNSGGGTFTWSAASSAPWLTFSTAPGLLTISVNPSGLSPDTYTGTITITAAGASNSPQTISVTLTATAPSPVAPSISLSTNQATFTYTVGGAAPSPQSISISTSGGGTLAWSASSNAAWLSVTPSGPSPSNLTISVTPASLTPGPYNGAITVTATGAANSPQTISVALTVSAAASSVVVSGVTNAASFAKDANGSGSAVAPGSLVSIFGSYPGATAANATTATLPTSLGGVSVTFNGIPAPLSTVVPTGAFPFINAQVPFEVLSAGQTSGAANVVVTVNGVPSTPQAVPMVSAAPGAFTIPPTGQGNVILAFVDPADNTAKIAAPASASTSIGYPTAPIPVGQTGFFYATGLGAMTPPITDGVADLTVTHFANATPTVMVGGVAAQVQFAGQAPPYAGVNQINIVIPNGAPTGDAVPLQIQTADGKIISTPGATIAIRSVSTQNPQLVSLTLSPASAVGGGLVTATVTLSSAAPGGGIQVSLLSGNLTTAQVPTSVTIPAGQTSTTFAVSTTAVTSSQTVTITATLGASTQTAVLTVSPATGANGASVQGKSFKVTGTVNFGGQSSSLEIEALFIGNGGSGFVYALEIDHNPIGVIPAVIVDGATSSVSGNSISFDSQQSNATVIGSWANPNGNVVNVASVGITLNLASPTEGGGVTGTLVFNGSVTGTLIGTLSFAT